MNRSAPVSDFVAYLLDVLQPLGPLRARRMFGGYGLYCHERIFALVADDTLYIKADAANKPQFEAVGLRPFQPFADKPSTMPYYPLPSEALDDADVMLAWARLGVEAAARAPAKQTIKTPHQNKVRKTNNSVSGH